MSKVLLTYKQREPKPHIFVERFGMKVLTFQNGTIDYDQEEEVEVSKVNDRINELKSFKNRSYHTFSFK